MSSSVRFVVAVLAGLGVAVSAGCSETVGNATSGASSGAAAVTGLAAYPVKSATRSGDADDAGASSVVIVQLLAAAPGIACSTLENTPGDSDQPIGMLIVSGMAATSLPGQTLPLGPNGVQGSATLTFAQLDPASTVPNDFASTGSVTFSGTADDLKGTFTATLATSSDAGASAPVQVTGSFDAPSCVP